MGQGMKRIKGIKTGRFVAMNANGDLYSTVRCHFKESYFWSSLCFSFLLCKGSQYKQENIFIFESLPSSFHARWVFSPRWSHSLIGTNTCKPLWRRTVIRKESTSRGRYSLWWPIRGGSARKGYLFQSSCIWKGTVGISQVEAYERVGKFVIWVCKRAQKG